MASSRAFFINEELLDAIDKELAAIGVMHRMKAMKEGVKNAGKIVEQNYKMRLPLPGYPGDKPGLKPLRNTITTKVKEYSHGIIFGIAGAEYPAGSHHHLVNDGHDIVSRKTSKKKGGAVLGHVPGSHLLEKVIAMTETDRDAAVLNGIRDAITEAKKQAGTAGSLSGVSVSSGA